MSSSSSSAAPPTTTTTKSPEVVAATLARGGNDRAFITMIRREIAATEPDPREVDKKTLALINHYGPLPPGHDPAKCEVDGCGAMIRIMNHVRREVRRKDGGPKCTCDSCAVMRMPLPTTCPRCGAAFPNYADRQAHDCPVHKPAPSAGVAAVASAVGAERIIEEQIRMLEESAEALRTVLQSHQHVLRRARLELPQPPPSQ